MSEEQGVDVKNSGGGSPDDYFRDDILIGFGLEWISPPSKDAAREVLMRGMEVACSTEENRKEDQKQDIGDEEYLEELSPHGERLIDTFLGHENNARIELPVQISTCNAMDRYGSASTNQCPPSSRLVASERISDEAGVDNDYESRGTHGTAHSVNGKQSIKESTSNIQREKPDDRPRKAGTSGNSSIRKKRKRTPNIGDDDGRVKRIRSGDHDRAVVLEVEEPSPT
ncbi:MAG: hypothetical protein L6R39_005572, partial [Caloplaca ligustica]